jgi:microcystin-dependent protein
LSINSDISKPTGGIRKALKRVGNIKTEKYNYHGRNDRSNLNGRVPIGQGSSTTGKSYQLGEMAGTPENTLLSSNLPSFMSTMKVSKSNANSITPSTSTSIAVTGTPNGRDFIAVPSFVDGDPDTQINPKSVSFIGQNLPVNNMPPYLTMNYIICVAGIYPSRS